jgi:hypothetical protein
VDNRHTKQISQEIAYCVVGQHLCRLALGQVFAQGNSSVFMQHGESESRRIVSYQAQAELMDQYDDDNDTHSSHV